MARAGGAVMEGRCGVAGHGCGGGTLHTSWGACRHLATGAAGRSAVSIPLACGLLWSLPRAGRQRHRHGGAGVYAADSSKTGSKVMWGGRENYLMFSLSGRMMLPPTLQISRHWNPAVRCGRGYRNLPVLQSLAAKPVAPTMNVPRCRSIWSTSVKLCARISLVTGARFCANAVDGAM